MGARKLARDGRGSAFSAACLPIRPREALRDAFAGVTLASMNIPQVLGYTRIAGTPVVTGLYTVLLPLVAFATFGSSRHLVVAAEFGHRGDFLQRAVAHGAAWQRRITWRSPAC